MIFMVASEDQKTPMANQRRARQKKLQGGQKSITAMPTQKKAIKIDCVRMSDISGHLKKERPARFSLGKKRTGRLRSKSIVVLIVGSRALPSKQNTATTLALTAALFRGPRIP